MYNNPCILLNSFITPPQVVQDVKNDHVANFVSPGNIEYVKQFQDECNHAFESSWMVKVQDLLSVQIPPPPETEYPLVREKRDLATIVTFVAVSNFIGTFLERINPWSDYHRINHLEDEVRHEQEVTQKFIHNFNVSASIQKGMLDLIKSQTRSVREQQKQLSFYQQLSSRLTWLSSYINTRLVFASADLRSVIESMRHGKVSTLELADLFNQTDLRDIDPRFTYFTSVKPVASHTLRFKFIVHNIDKNTHIFKIYAFRYWDNLMFTPQLLEYHGSPYVLYNKSINCLKGLEDLTETLIFDECSIVNYHDPKLNIWRVLIQTQDVKSQDVSSYKRTATANYIYCFPWNMVIDREEIRCPTLMFELPVDKPF